MGIVACLSAAVDLPGFGEDIKLSCPCHCPTLYPTFCPTL